MARRRGVCPHCGRRLEPRKLIFKGIDAGFVGYENCGCEGAREAAAAALAEQRRESERRALESRLASYRKRGLPRRFVDSGVDATEPAERLAEGGSIYLYGDVGTGKTRLATAAAQRWIDRSMGEVRFVEAESLMTELRACFASDGAVSEKSVLSKYQRTKALFIDDLGKGKQSPYTVAKVLQIVNYRYNEMLPMFITAQISLAQLESVFAKAANTADAEAIRSRLREMCIELCLEGPDHRKLNAGRG